MRQRSETWAKLAARGRFTLDVVAVIGGVSYTAISAPIIDRALFSDAMSVGNCISASLKFSVLTDDEIAQAASVIIRACISEGSETSEWLDFGTFYIDKREGNNGLIALQCYDSMLKASQKYVDPTNPDDRIGWPKSMQTCVNEIAQRIGVEIDPRTVINTAEAYQVDYPTNYTMQQVLGYIGAVHGGNWIITPENKLRLVPLISPPEETFDIVDYYYNKIYTDDGYKLVWRHYETDEEVTHPAGGDIINVPVVIDKITTGKSMTISRVTIARDEDLGYSLGDDTGAELRINENPYANQAVCDNLYAALNGVVYSPFTISKACYDPCTELGDWMLVGDQVRSVVYKQTLTFATDFRANASAPGKDENGSEYPYLTEIEKLHQKDEQLQKYIDTAKDEIDSQILQTRTSILLEVAGTYATQDEVSSDIEILAGEIVAEVERSTAADEDFEGRLTINENAITAEVSRAKGEEEKLSSSISVAVGKIDLKVSVGDVSSQISVETGKVTIGANRLTIESDNFSLSGSGKVTCSGSITSDNGENSTKIDGGGINFYRDGTKTGHIRGDSAAMGGGDDSHNVIGMNVLEDGFIIASNGVYCFAYNNGLDPSDCGERLYVGGGIHLDGMLHSNHSIQFNDNYGGMGAHISGTYSSTDATGVYVEGYLWVTNYLTVLGAKNRAVITENYDIVCLNAMESADAVFSDMGCGTLDDTGAAYIYFDPVFAETIDLSHEYQVFTTQTSKAKIDHVEKEYDYFIVYGEAGASFDWIAYARQKDYVSHRLEPVSVTQQKPDDAGEAIFYGDNNSANSSESYMEEFTDTYDEQAEAYLNEYEQEVTG